MPRRYVTVDVFTDRAFGGNPLAVVLDAEGLSDADMQASAAEFNYAETSFVLPPRDPSHDAHVRIFTPRHELPFAGHPNVGTAFVIGGDRDALVFEEAAGLVPMQLKREAGVVVGAEFAAPQPLSVLSVVATDWPAQCLSLPAAAICTDRHRPTVVSVGLPFLVVELASREALSQARVDLAAFEATMPIDDADCIYLYTRDVPPDAGWDIDARMFAPLHGIAEDPATGSATAAVTALLTKIEDAGRLSLRFRQGAEMGRPSLLAGRGERVGDTWRAHVGGRCVRLMDGVIHIS